MTDATSLALKAFDIVREDARKKIKNEQERVCCDTCGVSFKNSVSLKRHIRKQHACAGGPGGVAA